MSMRLVASSFTGNVNQTMWRSEPLTLSAQEANRLPKGNNMNIEDIFTDAELALIDSGKYRPGRAVLDAKLDLAAAMEREACAKVCESYLSESPYSWGGTTMASAIRARGQA